MQSSKGPARRRADFAANREALIRAAAALYAERGQDVRFDDIAQAAGVGRATLYRHFGTHDELRTAILELLVDQLEVAASELPATPDAFMRLFKAALRVQSDNLPLVDLLPPPASPSDGVREQHARVRELFRSPLSAAQEAGRVRADVTPQDVRIQLLMLSAVLRPDTPPADRRRAWRLAEAALGMTSLGRLPK